VNDLEYNVENKTEDKKRYLSIDVFKGLTILLMVFVNSVQLFDNVPAWTKHAGDYGLTYVDLIAPFFVFMMALNYKTSFLRRVDQGGRLKTYIRFIQRYLIFIGIGLLLTINIDSEGIVLRWGTLQVLGISGLILLPLIELNPIIRLTCAFTGMIIHQFLLETNIKEFIYMGIEGGFIGSLSWGSMMILSSVLAEGLINRRINPYFLSGGTLCTILGISTNFIWGISRAYISISYLLISVGIASLLYYGFYCIFEIWGKDKKFLQKDNFLSVMGKNAFILFIFHFVLVIIMYSILPSDSHFLIVFAFGFLNVFIIWITAFFMNR
jgi:predicted acyltransferase